MTYPVIYDVTYSYSVFQQSQGNNAFPGTQVDADFAGLADSLANLSTFVQGVMRSDGALQNNIVTFDSLAPSLQTAGLAPAAAWATGVAYLDGNSVVINSNLYRLAVPHTSGVFATDLAAGKWTFVAALLQGPQGVEGAVGPQGVEGPQGPAVDHLFSTLTITPTANSLTQGLNIVQSGPSSGTTPGPWSYNLITVTDSGNVLSTTGTGLDAFDLIQSDSSAFRVNDTVGGDEPPIRLCGTFAMNYTGSSSNAETVGLIGSSYCNTTVGAQWGVIGYSSLGPAGTTAALIPVTAEVSAQVGSSVLRQTGFLALAHSTVHGSLLDAAYTVSAQGDGHPFGAPLGWKTAFMISNSWFGTPALAAGSSFFAADSATTISNWAKMDNVTVDGNIMLFPNLNVPGAAAGFTLPAHPSSGFQYGGTNAGGVPLMVNAFTGQAQFIGTRADTSSTAPSAVTNGETVVSFTAQAYDSTGYFEIAGIGIHAAQNQTASAHGSYMAFFTTPLNSTTETEAGRFGASGALLVGTTTDAAPGVVNVATGFRVGNAAGSGHVLRGDGTNFVDSPLAVADLADAAWTTYTPSVAAQTGSGVTATVTGRYKRIGKTIIAQADITITAVGTGSGGLVVGLPFAAAAFQYAGACREYNLSGAAGAALVLASASTMDLRKADTTTYIVLNYKVVATVTYEIP